MNEELNAVRQDILDSKTALKWLELADMYIEAYNKNPKIFVLPTQHNKLAAIIEAYHNDLGGFRLFIRGIRDEIDVSQKIVIHELYRRLNSRLAQATRRERLNKATELIEGLKGFKFNYIQRQAVQTWLTQFWHKQRSDFLQSYRVGTSEKRLTSEQRTDLSEEFWDSIDQQLENNIFPDPPEIVYAKLASLEPYKPNSL